MKKALNEITTAMLAILLTPVIIFVMMVLAVHAYTFRLFAEVTDEREERASRRR